MNDLQSYTSVVFTVYGRGIGETRGKLTVSWHPTYTQDPDSSERLFTDAYEYTVTPVYKNSYTFEVPVRARWMTFVNEQPSGGGLLSSSHVTWVPKTRPTNINLYPEHKHKTQAVSTTLSVSAGALYCNATDLAGSRVSGLNVVPTDACGRVIGVSLPDTGLGLLNVVATNVSGMPQAGRDTVGPITGTGLSSLAYALADNSGKRLTSTRTAALTPGEANALYITPRHQNGRPISSTDPLLVSENYRFGRGYPFDSSVGSDTVVLMDINTLEGHSGNLYSLHVTNIDPNVVWIKVYDLYKSAADLMNLLVREDRYAFFHDSLVLNIPIPGCSSRDFYFENGVSFKQGVVVRVSMNYDYDSAISNQSVQTVFIAGNFVRAASVNDGTHLATPEAPPPTDQDQYIIKNFSSTQYGGWFVIDSNSSTQKVKAFLTVNRTTGLAGAASLDVSLKSVFGEPVGQISDHNRVNYNVPKVPPTLYTLTTTTGEDTSTELSFTADTTYPTVIQYYRMSVSLGGIENVMDFPIPSNREIVYNGANVRLGTEDYYVMFTGLTSEAADTVTLITKSPYDMAPTCTQIDLSGLSLNWAGLNIVGAHNIVYRTDNFSPTSRMVLIDGSCCIADISLAAVHACTVGYLPQRETSDASAYFFVKNAHEVAAVDEATGLIAPLTNNVVCCYSTAELRGSTVYDNVSKNYTTNVCLYHEESAENTPKPVVMYERTNRGTGVYIQCGDTDITGVQTAVYNTSSIDTSYVRIIYCSGGETRALDSDTIYGPQQQEAAQMLTLTPYDFSSALLKTIQASNQNQYKKHFYNGYQLNYITEDGHLFCNGVDRTPQVYFVEDAGCSYDGTIIYAIAHNNNKSYIFTGTSSDNNRLSIITYDLPGIYSDATGHAMAIAGDGSVLYIQMGQTLTRYKRNDNVNPFGATAFLQLNQIVTDMATNYDGSKLVEILAENTTIYFCPTATTNMQFSQTTLVDGVNTAVQPIRVAMNADATLVAFARLSGAIYFLPFSALDENTVSAITYTPVAPSNPNNPGQEFSFACLGMSQLGDLTGVVYTSRQGTTTRGGGNSGIGGGGGVGVGGDPGVGEIGVYVHYLSTFDRSKTLSTTTIPANVVTKDVYNLKQTGAVVGPFSMSADGRRFYLSLHDDQTGYHDVYISE